MSPHHKSPHRTIAPKSHCQTRIYLPRKTLPTSISANQMTAAGCVDLSLGTRLEVCLKSAQRDVLAIS